MNTNYSVRFYINPSKAKGARKPIYLRITVDRRKVEMVTPYKIELKEWEDTRQRTRRNVVINQGLNQLESDVAAINSGDEKTPSFIRWHAASTTAIPNASADEQAWMGPMSG
jgi:hypothetical protein